MKAALEHPARVAAGAAVALRLGLIAAYPALFGGDSVVRLANADRVLLSYQLPALQAVVHLLWSLWPSQWGPRLFVVAASGAAAAGFYRLVRGTLPQGPALAGALLFALNPFLAAYSIVPYQEMLMLAALAWAFAWAHEGREAFAAAALALACLTRYEAWLACPALWLLCWRARRRSPGAALALAAAFAAAPLAWMLWNAGLTPSGSFAVESELSLERLWRWAYLGWIALRHAWFLIPLAAAGAWSLARNRAWREPPWQGLALFGVLFAVAILLSAHGERDQPARFVTAREAHLPIAFLCLLAAHGLALLRRRRIEVAIAALALSLVSAVRFVASETADPHVALARRAAELLDQRVGSGETVLVLARPLPSDLLERFFDAAERQGGPPAREAALRNLLSLRTEPPDYQRILVQSRLRRDQLRSLASLPAALVSRQPAPVPFRPDWVLLWSDFAPGNDAERDVRAALPQRELLEEVSAGETTLRLYR